MEIMIVGCWSIWDQTNDAIFNGNIPNHQRCISIFKSIFTLTMHRAKPSLKEGMNHGLILYENVISTTHVNIPFIINRK
jgi:hypothetical protein